jgi:beta-galactosidase
MVRTLQLPTEKVGFKTFEFVKKGPFMLNGKRLLLKGTHRHEDHAGVGAAMTEEMIKNRNVDDEGNGRKFYSFGSLSAIKNCT